MTSSKSSNSRTANWPVRIYSVRWLEFPVPATPSYSALAQAFCSQNGGSPTDLKVMLDGRILDPSCDLASEIRRCAPDPTILIISKKTSPLEAVEFRVERFCNSTLRYVEGAVSRWEQVLGTETEAEKGAISSDDFARISVSMQQGSVKASLDRAYNGLKDMCRHLWANQKSNPNKAHAVQAIREHGLTHARLLMARYRECKRRLDAYERRSSSSRK